MSEQTANLCTTDACESLRARLAKYEDAEGRPVVAGDCAGLIVDLRESAASFFKGDGGLRDTLDKAADAMESQALEIERLSDELDKTEARALKWYHQINAHVDLYRELKAKHDALTASAPSHGEQVQAWRDVLAERHRQITAEDFDASHDDMATRGQIAMAAGLYAIDAANLAAGRISLSHPSSLWPWPEEWWKPAGSRRNLIKAGALILAEIERLDRANAPSAGSQGGDV